MNRDELDTLKTLIRGAGVEWVLESDPGKILEMLRQELKDVEAEYARRYDKHVDTLRIAADEPEKHLAFIQSLAVPLSTDIRTMVLRLVQGASIQKLGFNYEQKLHVKLSLTLQKDEITKEPSSDQYESTRLWDVDVLRHIGHLEISGRPVLEGYYAFRIG
jgi:hypothetical protein